MAVLRTDLNTEKLINKDSISAYSPWIVLNKPHTIVAVGLTPKYEVHFEIAVIKSGALGTIECCTVTPPTQSDIARTEKLYCPTCSECDKEYMRLTAGSTFMMLEAPQGAAVRAVLSDALTGNPVEDLDVIQSVEVFTYIDTDVKPRNAAERGCPPKTEYTPTYKFPSRGLGYSPNDRFIDPKATVELNDCDGELLANIYPTPQTNATTPVQTCDKELLGYAVNSEHGSYDLECDTPARQVVQILNINGVAKVVYNDGTTGIIK